jgi:predicted O-methyltransferase YrrM
LTLAPDQKKTYRADNDDNLEAAQFADRESDFVEFVYSGSDVASKITQLFGDSKRFDETPHLGKCDLVFVDGSHAYSYVKSDSEKALRMLRPGGLLLWHDYDKGNIATGDVYKYLNELSKVRPLHHIDDTSLVVFKSS